MLCRQITIIGIGTMHQAATWIGQMSAGWSAELADSSPATGRTLERVAQHCQFPPRQALDRALRPSFEAMPILEQLKEKVINSVPPGLPFKGTSCRCRSNLWSWDQLKCGQSR
eukprot:364585-Chlamydomonas_euryale.AAC.21